MKVIDAAKQFACQHEFCALPYGFTCHKCLHTRQELPISFKRNDQKLFFFPASKASSQ